ncbi:GH15 family glucan-1,4-alpha-glucosidase [Streptomyces sp. B4I13]|nr:GH15 family glucan-1,4-alpha-glucosidase [Streptomyces sp. B4I13]
MDDYPLIENHGLIGDLQTAALVTTDGSVDWFCVPRFDSPSVFGALLDKDRGGHCTIRPRHRAYATKQLYLPDTAILVTRFMTEAGTGEVIDFMPVTGTSVTGSHRLVHMVRCVRGRMMFDVEVEPRFDYGRKSHRLHLSEHGAVFVAEDGTELTVHPVREPDDERLLDLLTDRRDALPFTPTLEAGQERGLVLERSAEGPPREMRLAEYSRLFDETVAFWRSWLHQSRYTGRWRETVERSAITLKLMTYAPTGAVVAAHRRPRSRSNWGASATGTTASPGSATPRSRCTPCSGWASPTRPGRSSSGSQTGSENTRARTVTPVR